MTDRPHDDSRLMDHEYDGIREYDNPLPGWWSWLFAGTIFFSIFYLAYYHIGVGPSVYDRYDAEGVAHLEKLLASFGGLEADDAGIHRNVERRTQVSVVRRKP